MSRTLDSNATMLNLFRDIATRRRARSIELSTGTLAVETSREYVPLAEMLDFAARHNPRRGFLFVAKDIGRYVAVRPDTLLKRCAELARRLPATLPGPMLCVGVAEAGIALGQGVVQAYRCETDRTDVMFWHSSRLRLDI